MVARPAALEEDDDMSERLLSLPAVAARTETSSAFWRKRVARGEIPVVRVGRCVRIREADLEAWLRIGLRPARPGVPARERARE